MCAFYSLSDKTASRFSSWKTCSKLKNICCCKNGVLFRCCKFYSDDDNTALHFCSWKSKVAVAKFRFASANKDFQLQSNKKIRASFAIVTDCEWCRGSKSRNFGREGDRTITRLSRHHQHVNCRGQEKWVICSGLNKQMELVALDRPHTYNKGQNHRDLNHLPTVNVTQHAGNTRYINFTEVTYSKLPCSSDQLLVSLVYWSGVSVVGILIRC